jgi:hypothetical protein
VTPAGNPGVLELTSSFSPASGGQYTIFFTGAAGTLTGNLPQDDRRRIKSQAKISFYDAASCALCDLLLLPPGTDPSTIPAVDPVFGTDPHVLLTPGAIVPVAQWEGSFDVVVRTAGTLTVVAGPTQITLKDAGLYGIILSDNPNGTTMDMTFIEDFK